MCYLVLDTYGSSNVNMVKWTPWSQLQGMLGAINFSLLRMFLCSISHTLESWGIYRSPYFILWVRKWYLVQFVESSGSWKPTPLIAGTYYTIRGWKWFLRSKRKTTSCQFLRQGTFWKDCHITHEASSLPANKNERWLLI